MPTMMNVNEAKANFSSALAAVEREGLTVTIMRYGHPVARLVPVRNPRSLSRDPFLSQVKINGSLFDDDTSDWEAMND